nr:MAG TPA: hypothetical protein [Caudoviricetes sp.]
MKTLWSVELEGNMWNDDTFNGTFDECVEYCEEYNYLIDGKEARLAKILVDENGCVLEALEIVNEL